MTTVSFTTLGCRLNQAESDAMAEDLAAAGVATASRDSQPDIVVVNTCTVTREATKASRMAIRRAVRDNPQAKVVVAGCYAVSNPEEIEAIEGVHAIVGNDEKERFVEARRLVDAQPHLLDLAAAQLDVHRALALDAR